MVIGEWVYLIQNYLQRFPTVIQLLGWLILLVGVIFVVFVAFSLLLGPFMWLYNRITDKNRSNVISRNDFVIGELTEKIVGDTIGEVMEIGSQSARSVYPARFFREEDRENNVRLPVGTKVIIVDFDKKGIALVVESKNFIE